MKEHYLCKRLVWVSFHDEDQKDTGEADIKKKVKKKNYRPSKTTQVCSNKNIWVTNSLPPSTHPHPMCSKGRLKKPEYKN